jgi:hypothetical protein
LRAPLEKLYVEDAALHQRVLSGSPATPRHHRLRSHVEHATRAYPRVFTTPPRCWGRGHAADAARQCSCSACCHFALGESAARCARCVLSTPACGGLPRSQHKSRLRLPAAAGPACASSLCNTCAACCTKDFRNHGESCYSCEASRCTSPTVSGHGGDGPRLRRAGSGVDNVSHWNPVGDPFCGVHPSCPRRLPACSDAARRLAARGRHNASSRVTGCAAPPRRDAEYALPYSAYHRERSASESSS